MKYTPVIGLEVHVELKTQSKMFCSCKAEYFAQKPNSNTCPVCLGLPGALPVPNAKAIEWCVMIGMALGCDIPLFAKFDRKNYFYPDLAKGYQISQYDEPFCLGGHVILGSKATPESPRDADLPRMTNKKIRIRRVHMEEDTAKLTHQLGISNTTNNPISNKAEKYSLIDFNRSGVPLVEIVTEPDFDNATDVKEYLQRLQQIVRYLNVSDADMEKGNMRLEPNISLRPVRHSGEEQRDDSRIAKRCGLVQDDEFELPNYKVEVKNINSFRFVEKAINFEIDRQAKLLDVGKRPDQETRGWDEKKNATVSQRLKEEANDYRYFPEPDIPPIRWEESQISNFKSQMIELPDAKLKRFIKAYGLSEYDTEIITRERETADYFETACRDARGISNFKSQISNKSIANYIVNRKIDITKTLPAELIQLIMDSSQKATIDEDTLAKVIEKILKENEKAVSDYKSGKEPVIMYLVGQVMKNFKEKIDSQIVKLKLQEKLKE